MNIKKFISERMVQYNILSIFIGLLNFFMIISLYINQFSGLNPVIIAPIIILSVFGVAWIVKKLGYVNQYYDTMHNMSPVYKKMLKNQEEIRKRLEEKHDRHIKDGR